MRQGMKPSGDPDPEGGHNHNDSILVQAGGHFNKSAF